MTVKGFVTFFPRNMLSGSMGRCMLRPKKGFGAKPRGQRSTVAGEHRPVLLEAVLTVLNPQPTQVVVDCTVGWAGHAVELLQRIGQKGRLIGLDLDAGNMLLARKRLALVAC